MTASPPNPTPRRLVRLGLLLSAAAVVATAVWHWARTPPDQAPALPGCPSWSLCGVHCSGCGMTRAARAAAAGDLPQMVAYNPFSPLALPLLAVVLGRHAWWWAWGRATPHRFNFPTGLLWAFAGLVLAFGVVRNFPWHPFTLLAPHELSRGVPPP